MYPSTALAILATASTAQALVLKDNIGKLPALGWNSWNAYGCDINSTKILTAANELVSLGLKDAGYSYINIDDCWSVKSGRDNVTGQIIPDPTKFPQGIIGIADSVHALGLKVGIYSSAGTETCGGFPLAQEKIHKLGERTQDVPFNSSCNFGDCLHRPGISA